MDVSSICVVFFIVTSCVVWKEVETLQCYQCSGCNDPFKESEAKVVSCSYACMKSKAEKGSEQHVIRDCLPTTGDACVKQDIRGIETNVCSCTKDKCNGAKPLTVKMFMSVIVSASIVLLKTVFF